MYDLLRERLIGVRLRDGSETALTLPGVLEALGVDRIEAFTALQAWQEHAWYALLTQLGALGLELARGQKNPVFSEQVWAELLIQLGDDRDSPWHLVSPDASLPAFLQPPAEGIETWKKFIHTPDQLDILVTSKNHDVKAAKLSAPEPQHWLYALVSLQTMQGFLGAGNYGIARMKGGFGSRPCVALAPSLRLGERFVADIRAMRHVKRAVAETYGYPREGGLALIWTLPWDGKDPIEQADLHPWFVEVCRRVRLQGRHAGLYAVATSSRGPRIVLAEKNGATGDPWTPLLTEDGTPFTLGGGGFNYSMLARLLVTGEFRPSPVMAVVTGPSILIAQALVRGQGITDGYHEQATLPLPQRFRERDPDYLEALRALSETRLEQVRTVRLRVLFPAMKALVGEDQARLRSATRAFETTIGESFFAYLWADAGDSSCPAPAVPWLEFLKSSAQRVLEEQMSQARDYKAMTVSENIFHGSFFNRFLKPVDPDSASKKARARKTKAEVTT